MTRSATTRTDSSAMTAPRGSIFGNSTRFEVGDLDVGLHQDRIAVPAEVAEIETLQGCDQRMIGDAVDMKPSGRRSNSLRWVTLKSIAR